MQATSIMSNPKHRPAHVRGEPGGRREIAAARLVVQNGVGYDDWAATIENAPGFDYQSWMLVAVNALTKAVTSKVSTARL